MSAKVFFFFIKSTIANGRKLLVWRERENDIRSFRSGCKIQVVLQSAGSFTKVMALIY
jgi:hypothetical protein